MASHTKQQITIRVSTGALAYLDGLVQAGEASSRADAVTQVVEREERRRAVERYVEYHRAAAQRESTEDEKRYQEWVRTRVVPPMEDDHGTDWEALTAPSPSDWLPLTHA